MEGPIRPQKNTLEKIKDWTKIGALVGASFFAGRLAIETYDNYKKDSEYENHLEHSMTQQENETLSAGFDEIKRVFGQEAVDRIKMMDKIAFLENKEASGNKVSYKGFNKVGLTNESVEKFVSEEFFFPKNWIKGEVGSIYFSDQELKEKDGAIEGMFVPEKEKKNWIVIFMRDKEHSVVEIDKVKLLFYIKHIGAHELAHANDWEYDNQSTILQRVDLLKKIGERLNSKNRFGSYEAWSRDLEYYESKEKPYDKAKEYWAEICRAYFSDAESLKTRYPADFDIVDRYIKSQDSNFNVFETTGPYFDGQTGELVDRWKKFTEDAISAK
jgi:hypothetical protein